MYSLARHLCGARSVGRRRIRRHAGWLTNGSWASLPGPPTLSSFPQFALLTEAPDATDHRRHAEPRRIDHHRILGGHHRGDRPGRILPIPLRYLARKGGKANRGVLSFQLLISPQRPFFWTGDQEHLQVGVRENYRAHVP